MPFSDDALRAALRRKGPSADFTERVLAKVDQRTPAKRPASRSAILRLSAWWSPWRRFAAAAAACLLAAVSLMYHRHEQRIEAANAREQTMLAFRIADEKLTLVLQHSALHRGILPQILETGFKPKKEHL